MKLFSAKLCLGLLALFVIAAACRQQPTPSTLSTPTATPAPTPYQLSQAGLQFELPADWTASQASPHTLIVSSPDHELSVSFYEVTEKEQKIAELLNAFDKDHSGVKKGAAKEGTFNGLPHTSQSGEATNTITNKTFEWSLDTLTAKQPLVIYSQVNRTAKDKYRQDYEKLISSLRPIQ
jgi:hypothetical protein